MGADYKKKHGSAQFISDSDVNLAANTTYYLGSSGADPVEGNEQFALPYAGYLTGFIARANSAPGAGETYTYTVRINGVPIALTALIAGAAQQIDGPDNDRVEVAALDLLSVELVTSLNANLTRHFTQVFYKPYRSI